MSNDTFLLFPNMFEDHFKTKIYRQHTFYNCLGHHGPPPHVVVDQNQEVVYLPGLVTPYYYKGIQKNIARV